ncbi:MAG: alpha/beta hydrolase [Phycisphaerales bacterium]|nr:MAG: alpha/beta hydrolase [Phycisphaerales bacterium]
MLIVTNRNLLSRRKTDSHFSSRCFGDTFNAAGPDELRLARAKRVRGKWDLRIIAETQSGNKRRTGSGLASETEFIALQERMRVKERHCVFFVHGFNNDLGAVLDRCRRFELAYGVEVVAFTWPANGHGLTGAMSYKSDKRDAKMSVNALDRALEKLYGYFNKYAEETRRCGQTINLVAHSMGNYLIKTLMTSSVYQRETLIFDNVIMIAADVNNENHEEWVNRIAHRGQLYITIHEGDHALRLSRMKSGEHQKARLGHYLHNLNSRNAVYLNFTDAKGIHDSHAYFEKGSIKDNPRIKRVFRDMFHGRRAERRLDYNTHSRCYVIE